MFKLNDMIPATPESSSGATTLTPGKARVVYIHPLGRFYVVRFDFPHGYFCESRWFTPYEYEEGADIGLFQRTRRPSDSFRPKGFVMGPLDQDGYPMQKELDEFDPAMI